MKVGKKVVLTGTVIIALVLGLSAIYYFTAPKETILHVSTTTSLYATGLLEELAERFKETHPNVVVQFIPVGSGEALRRAANGDADMVFVHAPSLEKQYIESGILIDGKIIAYNFFVIVGPASDPAGIKDLSPVDAFRKIFSTGESGNALFVSRGDNSGTHVKELSLWKKAGLNPQGRNWYIESGTGMSDTLLIANEKNAYTLSDIGTYLKLKAEDRIDLVALVAGGDELLNIYSVYIVNPEKIEGVNYEAAKAFHNFVASDVGQEIIAGYGVKEYGQPLFYPAKDKTGWLKIMWEKLSSG
ncbi:MAG: tungsten ABC transporter permease [Thermoprotei archaeon]|nr:MAG: tungsten ABC transporter permease [Thermoprotei archaeon]